MKQALLLTLGLVFASQADAGPKDKLKFENKKNYSVVGTVELKGKQYQKVVKANSMTRTLQVAPIGNGKVELFEGDLLKQGEFSHVGMLNGKFVMSIKNADDAAAIAKTYGLTIEFSKGKLAIVKAPNGMELSKLMSQLSADSRVMVVEFDKVTEVMQPE